MVAGSTKPLKGRVLQLLARAPHAYVAVETSGGPHVTPVLFTATADRIWFAVARSTLKARVLARRSRIGVLLDDGRTALVISGAATVLDPRRPQRLAGRLSELARAPLAAPAYGLRNPAELLGFARDAMRAPSRAAPPNLVLVSVEAETAEVLAGSVARRGAAKTAPASPPRGRWRDWLAGVPDGAGALARTPGPAVLGWRGAMGPLALPVEWEPRRLRARAPWPPFAELAREGPACICLDVSHGRGPAAKEGVLLRGQGRIAKRLEVASVSIEPQRITYWTGFDTGTVAAAPAG